MKTFEQFSKRLSSIPLTTIWRLADLSEARGLKTELVIAVVDSLDGEFSLTDLEHNVPGVNRDLIRSVLLKLKSEGKVESIGRGPGARWRKS